MPLRQVDDAMPGSDFASVIPAQLSFLTIYNPLLGPTDETLNDQIVFYTSRSSQPQTVEDSAADEDADGGKDEWNARLRQIGLAQGMVGFARWEINPLKTSLRRNAELGSGTFREENQSSMWIQKSLELSCTNWRRIGGY